MVCLAALAQLPGWLCGETHSNSKRHREAGVPVGECHCSATAVFSAHVTKKLLSTEQVASSPPASETAVSRREVSLFEQLGRPRFVLAPMVDQSFLPFRLLARRYGAQLCYTPMINAGQLVRSALYRREVLADLAGGAADRPLVAQIAGHEPAVLVQAARLLEASVDAIDLNLGCPQGIARRGRYGAYLLEEEDLVVDIVQKMSSQLSVPVTCKIRLFRGELGRTIRLCQRLQAAGCAMLTVHGRNRHQNKQTVGACDWSAIAQVKASVQIAVVANGGIATFEDVENCLAITGADAVMSSEAALENPAIFCQNRDADGNYIDQDRLADEYLELTKHWIPACSREGDCPKCVRAHLFKMLHVGLQSHPDLRDRTSSARSFHEYVAVAQDLKSRGWTQPSFHQNEYSPLTSWYFRHRRSDNPAEDSHQEGMPNKNASGGIAKSLQEPEQPTMAVKEPVEGDDEDDAPWLHLFNETP
mmetsp:Transcript_29497/g.57838  ORF Transcript_29497/g.57838 Transcript_29497/m.57838 type:complete len:474 (-) Transcript_29497:113-1534(-)